MDGSRQVTLLLCASDRLLGTLPPFEVEWPYWQEVRDVVTTCAELHQVYVTVLRLLSVVGHVQGGQVTYLAQVDPEDPLVADLPLTPWAGPDPLEPHPLRAAYANPDGPQELVDWARTTLVELDRAPVDPGTQMRSWNLSSIWQIPTRGNRLVWLKLVPSFYDHEGALLQLLAGALPGRDAGVPRVVAAGPGRLLLEDIAGVDQYGAGVDVMAEAITQLVALQHAMAPRLPELVALALPDRRLPTAAPAAADLLQRYRSVLTPAELLVLDDLVASLPARFAAAAAAGLPDTLVHGDFYQGNVRGEPGRFVILDWGDASIGNPVMDIIRLRAFMPADQRESAVRLWVQAWQALVPDSEPAAALEPFAPVAELLDGLTYQGFLDHIEPDERVYHAEDPLTSLRCAVDVATEGAA